MNTTACPELMDLESNSHMGLDAGSGIQSSPVPAGYIVPTETPEKKWWSNSKELSTHSLAEVEMRAPRYIIRDKNGGGLLPEGLCIISGDPKASKSTILRAFLSIFTSAQDQLHLGDLGECLVLKFEDDEGSIQLPDVIANGGNPWRFHIPNINCFKCSLKNMRQEALAPIAKFLSNHPRCKVVVIDVLSSILADMGINSHSPEKSRAVLEPLNKLGLEFGVSIVVLHHNHKSASQNQLHRLAGSIQVAASARLVWMVEKHPENDSLRVIKPVGGNIRGHSKGLVFAQEKLTLEEGLEIAKQFGVATTGDLSKLEFFKTCITDEPVPEVREEPKGAGNGNLAEQCAAFMASEVEAEGEVGSVEIEAMCLKKWTKGTYNRARILLKERGFRTVRKGDAWFITSAEPDQKCDSEAGIATEEEAESKV